MPNSPKHPQQNLLCHQHFPQVQLVWVHFMTWLTDIATVYLVSQPQLAVLAVIASVMIAEREYAQPKT